MNDETKTQPKHEDAVRDPKRYAQIFYRDDLETAQCGDPHCEEDHADMILTCGICRNSPTEVTFNRRSGLIVVSCFSCDLPLAALVLARREQEVKVRPS